MVAFRCYDPAAGGGSGIHGWYSSLPARHKAEIDAALELLASEKSLSGIPEVKPLHGACEGLTEIIVDFQIDKQTPTHIRILGFDGPGRNEFTLLAGFEKSKHNAIYGPHCRSAHQRKQGVERDGRRAPSCGFP